MLHMLNLPVQQIYDIAARLRHKSLMTSFRKVPSVFAIFLKNALMRMRKFNAKDHSELCEARVK